MNKELIKFIREARKRGFDDYEIRQPLMERGWPKEEIVAALASLSSETRYKNHICIDIDSKILHALEKRAKRNMLSVQEQIEDIIKHSVANMRNTAAKPEKLDDMLIGLFSRKTKKR